MAESRSQATAAGFVGLFCFAIFWTARFVPGLVGTYISGAVGALAVEVVAPIFGVVLTIFAAIKGSRWWVAVVAAGVTSWLEFLGLFSIS